MQNTIHPLLPTWYLAAPVLPISISICLTEMLSNGITGFAGFTRLDDDSPGHCNPKVARDCLGENNASFDLQDYQQCIDHGTGNMWHPRPSEARSPTGAGIPENLSSLRDPNNRTTTQTNLHPKNRMLFDGGKLHSPSSRLPFEDLSICYRTQFTFIPRDDHPYLLATTDSYAPLRLLYSLRPGLPQL